MSAPVDSGHTHPLAVLLGSDWRWFSGGDRQETLLLHPSGVHFYIADRHLLDGDLDKVWPLIAYACAEAVAMGVTGRCDVEMTSPAYEEVVVDPDANRRDPTKGTAIRYLDRGSARLVPVAP